MKRLLIIIGALALSVSAFAHDTELENELRSYLPMLRSLASLVDRQEIIVAFDKRTCPPDWRPYEPAVGRFLLGASEKIPFGKDSDTSTHSHGMGGATQSTRRDRGGDNPPMAPDGHRHVVEDGEHMPPYISVTFCIPERTHREIR